MVDPCLLSTTCAAENEPPAKPAPATKRQYVLAAAAEDGASDDERQREACDWDAHPAEAILAETFTGKVRWWGVKATTLQLPSLWSSAGACRCLSTAWWTLPRCAVSACSRCLAAPSRCRCWRSMRALSTSTASRFPAAPWTTNLTSVRGALTTTGRVTHRRGPAVGLAAGGVQLSGVDAGAWLPPVARSGWQGRDDTGAHDGHQPHGAAHGGAGAGWWGACR